MVARSLVPRLTDIVEAIERIHDVLENISIQAFETDWQRQWFVPARRRDHFRGEPASHR